MKTAKWILVLFLLMILVFLQTQPLSAANYYYSGNHLVELMKEYDKAETDVSDANYFKAGQYLGYVSGVGDAMGYVPAGLMAGQLAAVVSKYLTNHPEKWSEPAVDLVIKALQEAFPLKGGK